MRTVLDSLWRGCFMFDDASRGGGFPAGLAAAGRPPPRAGQPQLISLSRCLCACRKHTIKTGESPDSFLLDVLFASGERKHLVCHYERVFSFSLHMCAETFASFYTVFLFCFQIKSRSSLDSGWRKRLHCPQ